MLAGLAMRSNENLTSSTVTSPKPPVQGIPGLSWNRMRVGSTCSMDTAPSVSQSHFSPGFTVTRPRETASMMSLSGAPRW